MPSPLSSSTLVRKRVSFPRLAQELRDAGMPVPGDVVGRKASSRGYLRAQAEKVLEVPFLVRVTENEIEGAPEFGHEVVCIVEPGLDAIRNPGLLEIG